MGLGDTEPTLWLVDSTDPNHPLVPECDALIKRVALEIGFPVYRAHVRKTPKRWTQFHPNDPWFYPAWRLQHTTCPTKAGTATWGVWVRAWCTRVCAARPEGMPPRFAMFNLGSPLKVSLTFDNSGFQWFNTLSAEEILPAIIGAKLSQL